MSDAIAIIYFVIVLIIWFVVLFKIIIRVEQKSKIKSKFSDVLDQVDDKLGHLGKTGHKTENPVQDYAPPKRYYDETDRTFSSERKNNKQYDYIKASDGSAHSKLFKDNRLDEKEWFK